MKFVNRVATALVLAATALSAQTSFAAVEEANPTVGGDVRAPSPRSLDADRRGYFQAALGPAMGIGFATDSLMYNIGASYNFNLNERWTLKGLADAYLGTGSVSSRVLSAGAGAEFYLPEAETDLGLPYIQAGLGLAAGRNAREETGTGLMASLGGGFKFQAAQLNMDLSAQYSLLSATIGGTTPSLIGAKLAVNF